MNGMRGPVVGMVLTGLIAGCGGGSGDASRGGIDGGGFSKGVVTGFGSVIVNGVTFATGSTTFTIDGRPGTQADLRVGDVVAVVGTISGATGTATSVTFDDDVEGPVQSIDVAAGTLAVLGQTVRVDGATSFDDSAASCTLDALTVGRIVEVTGFRTTAGEVRATRIECKAAGGEFEVTGVVQGLDTTQRRFQLSALTVDYSQAQLQNFPGGGPANGQTVEVKGTQTAGSVLTATRVELKDTQIPGGNGARAEIEGLVTRFAGASDFDVSGQRIVTNAGTRIDNCASPLNLPLNSLVEVEGTLEGGAITATRVECRNSTDLRVSATVDSVNAPANSLVVLGIAITVGAGARLEDKSQAQVSPFRLTDLRVGDFVEVRGGPGAAANSILAALLERDEPDAEVELRGIAQAVAQPNLTILGVVIVTDAGTDFEDEADAPISATDFFARAPGRRVNAKGLVLNGTIVADEVELED